MEISVKTFSDLSKDQLYELLRLRCEVFVVEQNCPYQDLDNKDQIAFHVLGHDGESLVAYTRFFGPGDYAKNTSIGRVVVAPQGRKHGYGKQIMEVSMKEAMKKFPNHPVELSAQTYLLKFYEDLGFSAVGEEYLEDGIPHVRMIK